VAAIDLVETLGSNAIQIDHKNAKVNCPVCSIATKTMFSSSLWKCLLSSMLTGNGWKISKFQGTNTTNVPNMAAEPVKGLQNSEISQDQAQSSPIF
jgi:ribosomal protein L37AE/L43A